MGVFGRRFLPAGNIPAPHGRRVKSRHTRAECDSANPTFGPGHNSFKRMSIWIALPCIDICLFSFCAGGCAVKSLVKSLCILMKVSCARINGLCRGCTHSTRVTVVFTAMYEYCIQRPGCVVRLLHAIPLVCGIMRVLPKSPIASEAQA